MTMPRNSAAAMAAALLDPDHPGPDDPRFAVHRNNVVAGLVTALGETYPAIKALVGEAFFDAAAALFVRAAPPSSPVLLRWGGAFPDWIDAFPPAAAVPYLGDVARLEWARTEAYHAAEATPLEVAALAALPPEALPAARLTLHPSLRLVASPFPVASLWADVTGGGLSAPSGNGDGDGVAPLDLATAETALIVRPEAIVTVRAVAPATARFVDALARGESLGEAVAATVDLPDFDLAAQIAGLFATGLVVGVTTQRS